MYSLSLPQLWGNLHKISFFGWKSDGKQCEGYFHLSSTLKLFGRYLGPLEKLPFLIISVLRFFISLKTFLFHSIISSLSNPGKSRHDFYFTSSLLIQKAWINHQHNTSICKTSTHIFIREFTYYKEKQQLWFEHMIVKQDKSRYETKSLISLTYLVDFQNLNYIFW